MSADDNIFQFKGLKMMFPMQVAGSNDLSHCWHLRICVNRRLEPELGIEPTYLDVGCDHLKLYLNSEAKCSSLNLYFNYTSP